MMSETIEDESKRVRAELAAAKRSLEISRRQKYGLERAVAARIGSEQREIESLIAVTRGDPRELAKMLIAERAAEKKRSKLLKRSKGRWINHNITDQ